MLEEIHLVSYDRSNSTDAIDMKMDWSVLEEKSSFKMLGQTLNWGSYIISIAETASKKIGALIRLMKFLSAEVALYLDKSVIRLAWNTVVMFGLMLLAATWNC